MEIGLFQLENIAGTLMPFAFFDLRVERAAVHAAIDPLLARAELVPAADVLPRLRELGVPPSMPIVLVCEDGAASRALASSLGPAGFAQVYVVEGGTRGLLGEVDL